MNKPIKITLLLSLAILGAYTTYSYYQKEEPKTINIEDKSSVIEVTLPGPALKSKPELLDLKVPQVDLFLKESNSLHLAKEAQMFFKEKDDRLALRKIFLYVQTDCPTIKKRCETKTKLCLIEKETRFAKSLDQEEAYCVADFKNCMDRIVVNSEISEFTEELSSLAKKNYDKAYAMLITFLIANKDNRKECEQKSSNIKECEVFSSLDCVEGEKKESEVGTFFCKAASNKCINESF